MATLKELLAQKASLDAQLGAQRKIEADEALAQVHALIAEFGFTAQQVFPWKPAPKKVTAKYYDPASGASWTGRGKPPAWIAGKDREDFLIEQPRQDGPYLAEMAAAAASR